MRRACFTAALALSFTMPALAAAAEDLTIVSRVTSAKGGGGTQTQYLAADRIRTSDGDTDTIVDLASGRITLVNNKKKEYSETTMDELKAFMAQLDQAMAGNPMMEKLMGKAGAVAVQKGTAGRKIAGYDTDQYILTMGDNMRFEIFAAPALPPPMQYFDARKALYATMGPMGKRFDAMFEEMKKIKGFPLATTIDYKMMMVQQQTLTEATEVKKGPIPASAFEVPAGFKKVASPFAKRG
jgi:hypothetical protein